jgi:hypothetical protein
MLYVLYQLLDGKAMLKENNLAVLHTTAADS